MGISINVPIYDPNETPLPVSGNTPFGYYDADPQFQIDAPKFVRYAAFKLGSPIIDIELQDRNFYQCLEEAVTVFGKELFEYQIINNYLSLQGTSTTTVLNDAVITPNLGAVIRIAETYGAEAGVGGTTPHYTGSLSVVNGQQFYDLNSWASSSLGITTGDLEVKRVFYEAPPAIVRFFDPYAGTGTGLQSLMETFGFGQFSPGINFMLMPINFDVLTIQAIEFNDQIRRSAFSFTLVDNQLRIFPIPTFNAPMWIEFIKKSERNNPIYSNSTGSISNISTVPYNNLQYSTINDVFKRWVFEYGALLCEEVLGRVRGKYQNLPIPNDIVTLDGDRLRTDGMTEKDKMIQQLRNTLEQTSTQKQLERKVQEQDMTNQILTGIPIPIYIM